jgi:CheY-like chemotaxis protein
MLKPTETAKRGPPVVSIELDASARLVGLRILIVEDMGLIAVDLQSNLERSGCRIAGVAARLDEAMQLARTLELDGALLDLNLAGEPSYPVAAILRDRGIPFILTSGYDRSRLTEEYSTAPHLQKPFGREDLVAVMIQAFLPR